MQLDGYVADLQHRLELAAATGGDDARRLVEQLTAPLDAAVRLVLLDALSTAAGEISAELAPGSVDVRLRGGEPEFVVESAPPVEPQPACAPAPGRGAQPARGPDAEDGSTSRITLRLPDQLKSQVEGAAAAQGISVNSWLVRAVADALDRPNDRPSAPPRPGQRGGTRLTGWVR